MTPQKLCRKSMPHPSPESLFRIAFPFSAVQRFYRKNLFHPTFLLLRVEWETIPHLSQPLFRIAVLSSAVQRFYQKILYSPSVPAASSRVGDHAAPSPAVAQNSGSVFNSSKVLSEETSFTQRSCCFRVEWETMPHPDQPLFFLLLQVARILSTNLPSTSSHGLLP